MTLIAETPSPAIRGTDTMRAAVFHGPGDIRVEIVPRPHAGPGEAVIRVTLTTICGTDVHILKGEYPVRPGLVVGHEPVGVIDELGPGVTGYEVGDRVLVGAITPCGQCRACLSGNARQCGHGDGLRGASAAGASATRSTAAQAEYLLVPVRAGEPGQDPGRVDRRAGRAARRHPVDRVLAARSRRGRRIGDAVVVFAQGPIGLCATAGAKLMGASLIIGVDGDPDATGDGRAWAPTSCSTSARSDVVAEVKRSPAAASTWRSRRSARRRRSRAPCAACARRHGLEPRRLLGQALTVPLDAFAAGLGDHTHRHDALPGRQGADAPPDEHRRRQAAFDPTPLVTHRFALDDIEEAYDLFGNQRDGVLKVAIRP